MKKQNLVLLSLILSSKSWAADGLDKLYNFSEDIRDVVIKAPGGNPMPNREFHLTTEQADQTKALSSMDDSMRTHLEVKKSDRDCASQQQAASAEKDKLEKRVERRDFQFDAVVILNDKKFEQNSLGRFTSNDYINYMGQLYQKGNVKTADIYTVDALVAKYKSSNPNSNIDSLNLADKEKLLDKFAANYLGEKLPTGLLMKEMAFQNLVDKPDEWKVTLAAAKNILSTDQKVQLVSKLGSYFGNNYNYARAEAGNKENGKFVDIQALLKSVQTGTPGGVCRDIALAQTQVLKELGFSNNYVVAFKTLDASHATVISTDPATGKIIKFNYGETNEMKKGSGTEALIQDTTIPDHGLGFRVYDTNGHPVTKVPSEVDQMLKESMNADDNRDFNQRNFNLEKVGFSSKYVDGSVFTGKTSSGETLYGVSLYKNVAIGDYLTVGAGAGISKLDGNRSVVKIDQENLYVRVNAELTTPDLNLAGTKTSGFLGGSGQALISNNKETTLNGNPSGANVVTEGKNQIDGTSDFYAGVKNNYTTPSGNTSIDTKIYANFYPDWNNVASNDHMTPVLDSIVVQSGVSHNITDNTRALIDTAVVMKNYGNSIVLKGAFEDDSNSTRYTAGVATPLSRDMPSFLPGGETRAFASVEKMSDRYSFSIEYERNFSNNSNTLSIQGKVHF